MPNNYWQDKWIKDQYNRTAEKERAEKARRDEEEVRRREEEAKKPPPDSK